jgi:hypothetical protein
LFVSPGWGGGGGGGGHRPWLPWPRFKFLVSAIAALGLLTALSFVVDFRGTRAAYGLIAAVHAWIEIPILLLALAPNPTSPTAAPR